MNKVNNRNLTHVINWTIRKAIDDRTTLRQVRRVNEHESETGRVTEENLRSVVSGTKSLEVV